FLAVFDKLAREKQFYTDLHIGVVTSDYGAGPATRERCKPLGHRGLLQDHAHDPTNTCLGPVSHPWISYVYGPGGASTNNLPATQSLVDTFKCIASVGAVGCGFEHQLESV